MNEQKAFGWKDLALVALPFLVIYALWFVIGNLIIFILKLTRP